MKREAAVAGVFYPGDQKSLVAQLKHYLNEHQKDEQLLPIRALIVPHAGYVFSGNVAAAAYGQIKDESFETVFLIGSSHKASYSGAALSAASSFETPLGEIVLNKQIIDELCAKSTCFHLGDDMHSEEHSLEVQLPFIQELLPGVSIVPILIGSKDITEIQEIAAQLQDYFTPSNLFVISTDFSHYPPASYAVEEDKTTTDVICLNKPEELIRRLDNQKESLSPNLLTGLCGWSAVLTLQYITHNKAIFYTPLNYEHSGMKLTRDSSRVVGYQAIAVSESKEVYSLSNEEKRALLQLARNAVCRHLNEEQEDVNSPDLDVSGVFVSVYCKNELRGCIGQFESKLALHELIAKLAVDAAFYDSRFTALVAEDLDDMSIEISLLTPLQLIDDISEIEMGRHGIYIRKGFSQGTFLPKVGTRNNWSIEEFLGHCSGEKAKIGWDGWKDADIYTYEALIITDKDET
ncbi:AmmeMemoRadiSam system protein B [Carboxylicivirga sp. RSCT41]|uniref:AmmeMemoRadiSam system protein B n=1 Tax=Carboxylicivirga agarovorans TaxID=3417570 RepID=UPI003D32D627